MDVFFNYIGSYTSVNGRWKGEFVNHEHTRSIGERPMLFGGYEVGIGFSGTLTDEGAVAEATALVGKRSARFSAVLKKMAGARAPKPARLINADGSVDANCLPIMDRWSYTVRLYRCA